MENINEYLMKITIKTTSYILPVSNDLGLEDRTQYRKVRETSSQTGTEMNFHWNNFYILESVYV